MPPPLLPWASTDETCDAGTVRVWVTWPTEVDSDGTPDMVTVTTFWVGPTETTVASPEGEAAALATAWVLRAVKVEVEGTSVEEVVATPPMVMVTTLGTWTTEELRTVATMVWVASVAAATGLVRVCVTWKELTEVVSRPSTVMVTTDAVGCTWVCVTTAVKASAVDVGWTTEVMVLTTSKELVEVVSWPATVIVTTVGWATVTRLVVVTAEATAVWAEGLGMK